MPEPHVLLRNRRAQPVELHLPGGALVLAPGGEHALPERCLALPQLAWLLARKALDTRPLPAPVAPVAAAPPPARLAPVKKAAGAVAVLSRGKRRKSIQS